MKKLLFIAIIAAMAAPAFAAPTISFAQITGGFNYDINTSIISFADQIDVTHGLGLTSDELALNGAYVVIPDLLVSGTTVTPASPALFEITDGTVYFSGTLQSGVLIDGGTGILLYSAILSDITAISANQTLPTSPAIAAILTHIANGGTTVDLSLALTHAGIDILATGVTGGTVNGSIAVPVPGAFLLGGIGVACVGWIKRRRSL